MLLTTPSHTVRRLRSLLSALESGSDRELLAEFIATRSGDVFAQLVVRHGPMVLGLARRTLRDYQLAEDVFQATFLVLARKAGAIRGRTALAAWLYRVAYRIALRVRSAQARSSDLQVAPRAAVPAPLDELSARDYLNA